MTDRPASDPTSTTPAAAWRRFALPLVIGIAGTVGLATWAQSHEGPHDGPGMHGFGPPGMPFLEGHGLDHMLKEVNASDAQRTQIQQIVQAASGDMKSQREAGKTLHQRALTLFTQPTIDASAVEALRRDMLAQHDQVTQRLFREMLDISAVLTPEQRSKIASRMQQRASLMERQMQERRALDGSSGS